MMIGRGARAWVWVGALAVAACGGSTGRAPDGGPGSQEGGGSDAADIALGTDVVDVPDGSCISLATVTPIGPDAGIGACAFALAPPSCPELDRASINVFIGNLEVPHDPSHTDGWDYLAADDSSLELYGAACDFLMGATDGGTDSGAAGGLRVTFLQLVALRP
jgi:hypothetical protein